MYSAFWKIVFLFMTGIIICILPTAVWAKTLVDCNAPADPNRLTVYEFYGEAELDNLGTGLDSAGDFNGDGIVDIVAGSPGADVNDANEAGAAYVFLGSAAADANWDFRLIGEELNDGLGYAVAGVGDIDDDGFDDIAIGAPYNERTGEDRGAVWVIFGSEPPFGSRQITLTGDPNGPKAFGRALAGGDFNGDGYSDLVVAAPFDVVVSPLQYELAKVYVYFGGPTFDTTADVILEAEYFWHEFGWSVACAGDLNGDGFDDLVIGARYHGTYMGDDEQQGKAYIYFGGNPMDPNADVQLTGEEKFCWLGYSVAGAGDVNDDGFDDVLIGSPWFPGGEGTGNPAYGRVYLLFGGASMDDMPDVVFDGAEDHDQFGWSVDGGLDMNKDGFDDIIIGARFNDCAGQDSGAAYVYYGGNPMDIYPDISAASSEDDDALGSSVAMIGDWSESMPLAAAAAVWNDKGMDVNNPMTEGAFGAVFAFASPACILGDFDRDRSVNWTDLAIFMRHWPDIGCDHLNWCGEADMDKNSKVDFEDFALIAERWLQGCN